MKIVIVEGRRSAPVDPYGIYGAMSVIADADLVIGLPKGRLAKVLKNRLADDRIDVRLVGDDRNG